VERRDLYEDDLPTERMAAPNDGPGPLASTSPDDDLDDDDDDEDEEDDEDLDD
jgi:hypothetical protein